MKAHMILLERLQRSSLQEIREHVRRVDGGAGGRLGNSGSLS